jgi:acyl-coenzyme A thioesterase PaaI-like protein
MSITFDKPILNLITERELWRQNPDYNCFWSGPDNVRGLRLTPVIEPGRVSVRMSIHRDHSGVVGISHGGIPFTILDGLMAWLVMSHLGRIAVTTTATVQYVAPLRVGHEYEFEAVPEPLVEQTEGMLQLRGRVYPVNDPSSVCVKMKGNFFLLNRVQAAAILGRALDESMFRLLPV